MQEGFQPTDGFQRGEPAASPDIEVATPEASLFDGEERSLDPRSVTASRITALFWLLILAAPFGIFVLVSLFFAGSGAFLRLGIMGAAFVLLAAWSFYWPGLRYRHASYRVGERGLWIRRGVIWRSQVNVPKSRVQHTDVSQGPLQRRFDIATLILHTAGTQHAAVALSGLAHDDAVAIRNHLIEGGHDDAV